MSTGMRERLAALADEGTTGPRLIANREELPADLWRRGRRRQVRRALASLVCIAAISALVGIGGASVWQHAGTVGPSSSPSATMQLPARMYDPSPWIDGTDDAGPLGPLVALIGPVERGSWWSTSRGLVGISASSGEYRFLDLPDNALDVETQEFDQNHVAALSPDGTMLAYWIAGSPEGGTPCTAEYGCLEARQQIEGRPVAGVAVYDTVTGEVHRNEVASDHGLKPGGMAWSADTLRATYGTYDEGGMRPGLAPSRFGGQLSWSEGTKAWAAETDPAKTIDTGAVATGPESFVTAATRGKGYVEVGPRGVRRRFQLDATVMDIPFISPSGSRVAALQQRPSASSGSLLVAEFAGSEDAREGVRTRSVPDIVGFDIVGWRDEQHVVIRQSRGLVSVNVATGVSALLVTPPQYDSIIAADAWSAPVVTRAPHQTVDPRIRALLLACGAAVAWIAGWAVLSWWRRSRGRT